MKKFLGFLTLTWWSVCNVSAEEPHSHHELGPSLAAGSGSYLEPFEHLHFSRLGTPIVHSFGIEPALTGRDLFSTYRYRSGDGFSEHEIEFELEWAFTRRLGIILEIPYIFEKPDGESSVDGFGDLAIVPRAVLLEKDRFILTSQLEIIAPTGTSGFGGETALAPGIASWIDLGDWWTLNTQLAVEHVFDEDVNEFIFGFGLVKTLGRTNYTAEDPHGHQSTEGLFNLHLEVTGSTGLSGEEQGEFIAEGLAGVSYGLNSKMDLRVGYEFPLSSPRDFDGGVVAGFVWHF